jgi:acyl-CoA synthetase (AMP-forming)/AMP-acid ligase II
MTLPPPSPVKPGSVGQPIQEVRIVDQSGGDVATGAIGEIWVRGPKVASGYSDDPDATVAAFLPGGWFRTGDLGYLDDDGFLFLAGRLNELINRGGTKIAPQEVDDALLAHPAVREATTFAVPDERLGEDIAAAVVLEPGHTLSRLELRRWLLARLSPYKVPRRIWFLDALPRTGTGKVQRGALAERFLAEHCDAGRDT